MSTERTTPVEFQDCAICHQTLGKAHRVAGIAPDGRNLYVHRDGCWERREELKRIYGPRTVVVGGFVRPLLVQEIV